MLTRKQVQYICDHYKEWLAVRYKDDNIYYMCPNINNKKMKIGSFKLIKWKDGYKYKAEILKKGTEQEVKCYLSELGVKFEICKRSLDNDNITKSMESDLQSIICTDASQILLSNNESEIVNKNTKDSCINACNNIIPACDTVNTIRIENSNDTVEQEVNCYLSEICDKFEICKRSPDNENITKSMESDLQSIICSDTSQILLSNNESEIVNKNTKDSCINACNNIIPACDTVNIIRIENSNDLAELEVNCHLSVICDKFEICKRSPDNENITKSMESDLQSIICSDTSQISLSNNESEIVNKNTIDSFINACNIIIPACNTVNLIRNENSNDTANITSISTDIIYNNTEDTVNSSNTFHITEEANFKINKFLENSQSSNLNSDFQFPNLRNKARKFYGEHSKNENDNISSSTNYDLDSGSDYYPFVDNVSINSSLLHEMDSNESDILKEVYNSNLPSIKNDSEIVPQPITYESDSKHLSTSDVKSSVPFISKNFNFNGEVEKSKKKNITNKRVWDKTDHCLFCENNVTNFTRHLLRKHNNEIEVIRFMELPKGSAERKMEADILRKRGNFLFNVDGKSKIKPVRRPYEFETKTPLVDEYLPCKHCLGMFKKKYLFRHFKICKNVKIPSVKRSRAQADGQNMMLSFTEMDEELIKNVFPRMAADNVSFVAKSDYLIKAFGSRYLKSHKEKHLISVVSQKMRTLARYLIAMKCANEEISSLEDCLSPKYFDLTVKCSQQVAKYNKLTNSFASPSVILKLGQLLKQCCEIAEFVILKKCDDKINNKTKLNSVQNMKYLIEKQWSYEISTNASKDITQKKWNKPAILPLTSDIKLYRDHLLKIENESYNKLKVNSENIQAFRDLQGSILAQLILLNRRRSGEIQRMLLDTYINSPSEISQEEVVQALSTVETELTKNFKRIVIRGKRGRGVPVLFTPHLQKRLQYLLQLRKVVSFINKDNPYLFPLTQSSNNCVRACDIIRKFGDECGAKHPKNITSTRLRKHVATVTQLLNLSEGDIEQLSTFMGHSINVHKEFYRLSDNAFQVAKISKLLLMMEKGEGKEYRGKSLDEININIDDLLSSEDSEDEDEDNEVNIKHASSPKHLKLKEVNKPSSSKTYAHFDESLEQVSNTVERKMNVSMKKKIIVVPWSKEEKDIMISYFKKSILLGKTPRKKDCEEFLKLHPQIVKPWKKIKDFVHNKINSLNKK